MLSMLRRAVRVCAVKMWFLGEEVFPSKQEERKTSAPAGKTSTLKQSILSQILTSTLLVHFHRPQISIGRPLDSSGYNIPQTA